MGTLDPEILHWVEAHQRTFVTDNRKSLPGHIADHLASGGHHWGIFQVRKHAPLLRLAEILHLYWSVTEAEEWIDVMEWLSV